MPYKNPEDAKKYRELHKEKRNAQSREWRLKNKEYVKEKNEKYRLDNKEELKEKRKKKYDENREQILYEASINPSRIKSSRISNWKRIGVISDDFNALYQLYITTLQCQECDVELVEGNKTNQKKCLDHDHSTGEFRKILCNHCNNERWKKESK